MTRCPLTYERIAENKRYSEAGLKRLSPKLKSLDPLAFSAEQLLLEAIKAANKMSIQGIQPKLSAVLSIKNHRFAIVDHAGRYILKPPHPVYPEVPENEDITMRLASYAGIETPLHGLIYGIDDKLTYFIKRFDRVNQATKVDVEDFSQLSAHSRRTKYQSSMEQVAHVIDQYTTFPILEKTKLLQRTLFNFNVYQNGNHYLNNLF
ncbi:MAG: HipA domain-containing protein [Coxiellaceae bacterium]|nr:HipA domain-containing protein [Coxiellaceae bacterium]